MAGLSDLSDEDAAARLQLRRALELRQEPKHERVRPQLSERNAEEVSAGGSHAPTNSRGVSGATHDDPQLAVGERVDDLPSAQSVAQGWRKVSQAY